MYAVVDIKGFQYRLEQGEKVRVPSFDTEVGKKVTLSDVLLLADGGKITVGKPLVDGAVIEATVTEQGKYDKIVVFKKKRRKDYSVKRGHRQGFTELSIDSIKVSGGSSKKTASKKEASPKENVKASAKADTESADTKTETKETGAKKTTTKKAATKKSGAKKTTKSSSTAKSAAKKTSSKSTKSSSTKKSASTSAKKSSSASTKKTTTKKTTKKAESDKE